MADNLESYFKKHLSDETPGDDRWNVPPDEVWDKALPEIRKRKGIFIPWRYFYLSALLILAGLAVVLWLVTGSGEVTDVPAVAAGNDTAMNEMSSEGVRPADESTIINDGQGQAMPHAADERAPSDGSPVGIHKKDRIQGEGSLSREAYVSVRSTSPVSATATEDNTFRGETAGAPTTDRAGEALSSLPVLGPGQVRNDIPAVYMVLVERTAEIPDLTPEEKPVQFNNRGRFGLGAFYAPTFNTTQVIGGPDPLSLETGNVYLYSGNFGVELSYYVTRRLSVHTGFGKSEIKSWSRSEVGFAYDPSTEQQVPDGEKENTSAVPMATPFGEIDTKITYRFPGEAEIPGGEPMVSVLEAHQEVTYFSVPLGVEYSIIPFSKFNWFGEGGIRYNRAYRDATELDSRVLHYGEDMRVVGEAMESHPSYTEDYFNFYLGTGVNYQFNRSFLVTGSARYFRNFTKVNVQGDISTAVQGFGLKFGLVYIF